MTIAKEDHDLLNMEFRLTLAIRRDCDCLRYFIRRGKVLLPEVLAEAERRGEDPVDVFAAYARGVHDRHLSGMSLKTDVNA